MRADESEEQSGALQRVLTRARKMRWDEDSDVLNAAWLTWFGVAIAFVGVNVCKSGHRAPLEPFSYYHLEDVKNQTGLF